MRLIDLLANACSNFTCLGNPEPIEILNITNDSRQATSGTLFAAVPGLKVDGARFAVDACLRGATAILTERPLPVDVPVQLVTDNVRAALGELLSVFHGRPSNRLLMIGVTGTNGKTTVTHFLESILRVAGYQPGLIGTIYTRFVGRQQKSSYTTPDSPVLQPLLADMRRQGVDACVMELSSHALSLHRLAGCQFDGIAITNITHDHLDFHRSFEAYRDAKLSALRLVKPDHGISITNWHDVASRSAPPVQHGRRYSFGFSRQADVYPVTWKQLGTMGTAARIHVPSGDIECAIRLPGVHNLANALCAAALAAGLGLNLSAISAGLSSLQAIPGRLQPVNGRVLCGIVDFAHNPDGLNQLLSTCRSLTSGRIALVFGCEGRKDMLKRGPMGRIAAQMADRTLLTSDNWYDEEPGAIFSMVAAGYNSIRKDGLSIIPERDTAIEAAVTGSSPGDLIVIAGRGPERLLVLGEERHDFDDAEYLASCIAAREKALFL